MGRNHKSSDPVHNPVKSPGRLRDGEGIVVPVQLVRTGQFGATFSLDASRVPVPERKYVADGCAVIRTSVGFKLLFAQEKIGTDELRSLVVVHINSEGITHFLSSVSSLLLPPFTDVLANIEEMPLLQRIKEPSQTVALSASYIMIAISNADTCLDFLHSSAFSIASAQQGKQMAVEPVVRVEMGTGFAKSLIKELKRLTE